MKNSIKELEKDVCLYAASKSDFFAARKAAEILIQYIQEQVISDIKFHPDPLYSAIHCAVVVCYTKPFGLNNPRIKLKVETLDEYLSHEQKQLHVDLLGARDKCIAHSDHEFRNTTVYPPGTYRNNEHFYVEITNKTFFPSKIAEILSLIVHMEKIIDFIYPSKIQLLYLDKGEPSVPFKLTP
jgi:hypothetical protein